MNFCPRCSNLLLVGPPSSTSSSAFSGFRFFCLTCPYMNAIRGRLSTRTAMKSKQVDDVLGGEEAWKNVDQTEATCPKCENKRAYFMQIQTRSADEPMTTFYKCANHECLYQWKEG